MENESFTNRSLKEIQKPQAANEKPAPQPEHPRRAPERVPEYPFLTKKVLILSPFKYNPIHDDRLVKTHNDVPAVFPILGERAEYVLLGDQNGKPFGWKEKREGETYPWHTRIAFRTTGEKEIPFHRNDKEIREKDKAGILQTTDNLVFPVLEFKRVGDDPDPYVRVGPPLNVPREKISVRFPIWISTYSEKGQAIGDVGTLVSETDIKRLVSSLNFLHAQLSTRVQLAERTAPQVQEILESVQLQMAATIAGQGLGDTHVRNIQKNFAEFFGKNYAPDLLELKATDLAGFSVGDFKLWLNSLKRNTEALQTKSSYTVPLSEAGKKQCPYAFWRLDRLP